MLQLREGVRRRSADARSVRMASFGTRVMSHQTLSILEGN